VGRADRFVGRAGVHGAVREREAEPGGGQVRGAGCAARAVAAGGRRAEARARPSEDPFRVQGTYLESCMQLVWLWHGISLINATAPLCCDVQVFGCFLPTTAKG
jgi:hypothetical protein